MTTEQLQQSSHALDFANLLLAKHEANMRQREIERLESSTPQVKASPQMLDNQEAEQSASAFVSGFVTTPIANNLIYDNKSTPIVSCQTDANVTEQVSHFKQGLGMETIVDDDSYE